MTRVVLKCENLIKYYELPTGYLEVLKGVTFELYEQELLAIVGISGCGKTTLLNLIYGLDTFTSGTIAINGESISNMTKEQFRVFRLENLGIIFQDFHLLPSMNAIENVIAPLIIAGKNEQTAFSIAYKLLERVDMIEMANKLPEQLSNGQKQRVAIARAIANKPKILICDEPTKALDTILGDEIMNLISDLIHEDKIAVIITTHDPEVAIRAKRILVLKQGQLIEEKNMDKENFDFTKAKEFYKKHIQKNQPV